jgi:hypothetical protein
MSDRNFTIIFIVRYNAVKCSKSGTDGKKSKQKHNIPVRGYELERTFGKPKKRWEGNIKMIIKETGYHDWTGLKWLRTESSSSLL